MRSVKKRVVPALGSKSGTALLCWDLEMKAANWSGAISCG